MRVRMEGRTERVCCLPGDEGREGEVEGEKRG